MNGMLQTCFFFGYMGICCFGLFLMLGTVGWRVSTCPSPFTCVLESSDICHMLSVDECSCSSAAASAGIPGLRSTHHDGCKSRLKEIRQ